MDISANSVLPAHREAITLHTEDGLKLIGELATPLDGPIRATLIMLHPNPTGGGMMDSHVYRKAAWRLPAMAGYAILRFNTRGTTSAQGTSEGTYDNGQAEGLDFAAALKFAIDRGLPNIWVVGWSFGTNVAMMHANVDPVQGALLLSPTLKWCGDETLQTWADSGRRITAFVPEFDDYLQPAEAKQRFAMVPQCEVVPIAEGKHLWVGEKFVRIALEGIVQRVSPELELNWDWTGPMEKWDDLNPPK